MVECQRVVQPTFLNQMKDIYKDLIFGKNNFLKMTPAIF
jgi:hypothetical protein